MASVALRRHGRPSNEVDNDRRTSPSFIRPCPSRLAPSVRQRARTHTGVLDTLAWPSIAWIRASGTPCAANTEPQAAAARRPRRHVHGTSLSVCCGRSASGIIPRARPARCAKLEPAATATSEVGGDADSDDRRSLAGLDGPRSCDLTGRPRRRRVGVRERGACDAETVPQRHGVRTRVRLAATWPSTGRRQPPAVAVRALRFEQREKAAERASPRGLRHTAGGGSAIAELTVDVAKPEADRDRRWRRCGHRPRRWPWPDHPARPLRPAHLDGREWMAGRPVVRSRRRAPPGLPGVHKAGACSEKPAGSSSSTLRRRKCFLQLGGGPRHRLVRRLDTPLTSCPLA
jgi:hypothetical protein